MARKSTRAAQGAGTIRKKTVMRNGKEYTYWEARITIGRDPGTGKQLQKSFTGQTQKEVREKMQAASVEVNTGIYIEPSKLTVAEWLDIWAAEYLGNLKPGTIISYTTYIKKHINPRIGAIKLSKLHPHIVQGFVNDIDGLATATVRVIYKVLHSALEKAVQIEYIPKNPASNCVIPKLKQEEIEPLSDAEVAVMLDAISGSYIENLVKVALFTGMRLSELLGLTWDSINAQDGYITVSKQLARQAVRKEVIFITPKNGTSRTIAPAHSAFEALKAQKIKQAEMRLKAGPLWNNEHNLIFTNETGGFLDQAVTSRKFKAMLKNIGIDDVRFHDLRHTFAVNSLRAGDDIKTVQGNLGHSSASFTLDKYAHFTEQMKVDSADRMETFIKSVLNL